MKIDCIYHTPGITEAIRFFHDVHRHAVNLLSRTPPGRPLKKRSSVASVRRSALFRLLAIVAGAALALAALEIGLRLSRPYKTHGAASEIRHFREGGEDVAGGYLVDPDFGFRPRLGTEQYSEWGTLPNAYPFEKRPGVERVLFAGDSATHRGELVRALRRLYGGESTRCSSVIYTSTGSTWDPPRFASARWHWWNPTSNGR